MVFSAAISLYYQLASQGAAFTSFRLSLLTLASAQRALFFTYSFSLLFLVYTPVALLLRMDLRTLLHSFYPLLYRAFPALEFILQLSHHSTLQYLHNILHSKNVCFQTYISDLHVCQTSSMLTFLSDIP